MEFEQYISNDLWIVREKRQMASHHFGIDTDNILMTTQISG